MVWGIGIGVLAAIALFALVWWSSGRANPLGRSRQASDSPAMEDAKIQGLIRHDRHHGGPFGSF